MKAQGKTQTGATHKPAAPAPGSAWQPDLQVTEPHQVLRSLLRAGAIQAKLTVSQPGDPLEQEADRTAEAVMRMPAPAPLGIQRKSATCSREEEEKVQAKEAPGHTPSLTPQAEAHVGTLRGGGQPLSEPVRAFFEPRFGQNFSSVRVHSDPRANEAASEVQARAFTLGRDIVFGAGQYAPKSTEGQMLLAHELAHVGQQGQGSHAFTAIQRKPIKSSNPAGKDDETLLGEKLREPQFSKGISIAFYAEETSYAELMASAWAKRENAVGISGQTITAGDIVFGKAIPDSIKITTVVSTLGKVLRAALTKVPAPSSAPPATANAPAKIHTLAIFSHGEPGMCIINPILVGRKIRETAQAIAPELGAGAQIILFACSSARTWEEGEGSIKQTMEDGGAGSVAGELRDALVDAKAPSASVWGHSLPGKISKSAALREFKVADGKGQAGKSFASGYVFTDEVRQAAMTDLIEEITRRGYSIDNPKFWAAAMVKLTKLMYFGYEHAKSLPGVPIGEAAPLHPRETASRILEHWKTDYWPGRKGNLAEDLIKTLKLKKQGSLQ